jgi:glycosyltransferase involved in cell wall biosynthesis
MKDRGVTATIVGSGPDETRFKAMSSALGLDERVRFTGALPIREAFALGRIMVVPSRAESFPYVVLEAAAASLPLIATNVGGIPEIVAETDTPLIEAGSVSAIVASLTFGLDNPETLRARAETLRQKVGQKFTVTAMTDAILSFYGVLSERPGLLTQPTAKLQSHRG